MVKRGKARKYQEPEITSSAQVQQETIRGGVMRMKQEARLEPPPGFAPSPSRPQTRTYLKAIMDNCKFRTATLRSPVRNVKASHPSSTSREFAAHLITGISRTTKEKVHDPVHQSIITSHGALGVGNQKQGQHTQTAPSYPAVVVENNATVSKVVAVSNANATAPETRSGQSGARPTKSMSLNLTRIAALVNDYSSDDEIESQPDDLSIMVNGYKVKRETAPILEKIFHKHGDIARNSSVTSVKFSSSILELVCDIYKKLEATSLQSISSTELQSMLAEVRDLESVKVDIGWLYLRLNDIAQAKHIFQHSSKLKEAKTRNLVVMEMNKKGLEELEVQLAACTATCRALEERIRQKKDEFGIARSENKKIMQDFTNSKAKVEGFLKKSLVHDLL